MTSEKQKITDFNNPDYYDNREISWLSFNQRVLAEAEDSRNPLLERLGFISIGSSNLDEFMMVRVAGLQDQDHWQVKTRDSKKHWTPAQQLQAIAEVNHELVDYQYSLYHDLVALCQDRGIYFQGVGQLPDQVLDQLKLESFNDIYPALTPLGIDAYRPFPNLNNKVINLFVRLKKAGQEEKLAIVPLPQLMKRFHTCQHEGNHYLVYTEEIIRHFIGELFQGYQVKSAFFFRITRNADLDIQEEGAQDLLAVIEDYLIKRRQGMAVRIEIDQRFIDSDQDQADIDFLMDSLELTDQDLYLVDGPLDLTGLGQAIDYLEDYYPEESFPAFKPVYPRELYQKDLFKVMEKQDVFLHHPYDSFDPVVAFIDQAADDPDTLAIKQTLYRVSADSPIIAALKRAAQLGKEVTVLVELKARFDEENNVQWAKVLEKAGAHVIYGMTQLKTHSKIALVIKKKQDRFQGYVHLGTGNYNDKTARGYTDMGILTTNQEIIEDAINFFNYLSGYSDQPDYHQLHVSPFDIRDSFMEEIDEEIASHQRYGNGHIIAKMNSLTSLDIIKKLYEASQAGVKVDLIIRGICCLIPGIPGLSENIRVISVVGRFLEHSRIYYFNRNGQDRLFLSSTDMMTRNMIRRVEIEFPILDPYIKKEILAILQIYLDDNTKARYKRPDSSYAYVQNDQAPINAQYVFMVKARLERQQSNQDVKNRKWRHKFGRAKN